MHTTHHRTNLANCARPEEYVPSCVCVCATSVTVCRPCPHSTHSPTLRLCALAFVLNIIIIFIIIPIYLCASVCVCVHCNIDHIVGRHTHAVCKTLISSPSSNIDQEDTPAAAAVAPGTKTSSSPLPPTLSIFNLTFSILLSLFSSPQLYSVYNIYTCF